MVHQIIRTVVFQYRVGSHKKFQFKVSTVDYITNSQHEFYVDLRAVLKPHNMTHHPKGERCQPSSIRLVDNVQLKAGQFFRPDPGYLELLTDGLKKLYVTKILGFRDDEMCAATVLFEGDPEDVKNNEDKIYSIAKRYGGIPAGESNGRRGYMLTYIIAYIRDFACDYYFIGDSFETSVPWDKTVLLCINVKKRLTRECTE
ncbi:alkyldihydroxyacetonephosphate synthase, peroxisomal-like [Diaphorina citri]|uniref:Alkylglycerone-phosphate synthase n=1 Tax=Diaphorina citri TaxID=121845 RepID=A0A1S4EBN2_DIACI|nr:alkyldihydroxyacetonephosphate synthase, peroxisomal-like [Diaphorina citri]